MEKGFAKVAVFVPIKRGGPEAFHYSVPDDLKDRLRPGHLVWVGFGRRKLQGLVISLEGEAPVQETKPVESLVFSEPVLVPHQIALAQWISRQYMAPLNLTLEAMLPPGLTVKPKTLLRLASVPVDVSHLSPEQASLLDLLRRKPVLLDKLRKSQPELARGKVLNPLVRRGIVLKEPYFPKPSISPKKNWKVAPKVPLTDAVIKGAALALGRDSRASRLLHRLVFADEVRIDDKRTAKALEAEGWIEVGEDGMARPARPREELWQEVVRRRGIGRKIAVLQALAEAGEPVWIGWLYATTGCNRSDLKALEEAGLIELTEKEVSRDPLAGKVFVPDEPPPLTPEQESVWKAVASRLSEGGMETFLLFGVTGSGKTEIYLRAIEKAVEGGGQSLVLVPEISLTPQTVARFSARFPGRVAVWHSRLSDGERYDQWRKVMSGDVSVVVGSRSALFLPFPALRLIVVDECHESSYKQPRTPRYHARDASVALGEILRIPVILGSATPALESFRNARVGKYTLLRMPRRIMAHRKALEMRGINLRYRGGPGEVAFADLPEVQVVDMKDELKSDNTGIFSRALRQELERVLDSGQQAILFLNRRGTASFVMCRDCGYVMKCPRCGVPLTYHRGGNQLVCHHCGYREPVPDKCPRCGSHRIRFFGTGTERIESELIKLFPSVRTIRWDMDSARTKGAHDAMMDAFLNHEADVLIGTQMIAKGLDLPLVTLVGIVSADTSLFLPDFRAAERTFQLLTQVAGRAGRSALGGKVILQTYHPEHYAIRAASRHDYEGFYSEEIRFRRQMGYPPFNRIARLLYVGSESACRAETSRMKKLLTRKAVEKKLIGTRIIGPSPAFFQKLRGKHRWQLIVLSPDPVKLLSGVDFPPGWQVDIDPVDML